MTDTIQPDAISICTYFVTTNCESSNKARFQLFNIGEEQWFIVGVETGLKSIMPVVLPLSHGYGAKGLH